MADYKQFWRTVKPILSDKSKSNEEITLEEDNNLNNGDTDNVECSNVINFLKIPKFSVIVK